MKKNHRSSTVGEIEEYCRAISRIKPMTRDEEIACATALRDTGDQKYAKRLVRAHLLSVVKFVMRFYHFGFSMADLIQEGNIGLVVASQKYDVSMGCSFMTYAGWHIRAPVYKYLQNNWRIVKIKHSDRWQNLFNIVFSNRAMLNLRKESEEKKVPFFELLGEKIGVSSDEAEKMYFRFSTHEDSLDQPLFFDGNGRNGVTLLDKSLSLLGVAQKDDPAKEFLVAEVASFEEERVGYALNTLTALERLIIRRRFLRSREWTLKEIGDELGYTRERIRQIQNGALNKLRKYFVNEPYKGGKKGG